MRGGGNPREWARLLLLLHRPLTTPPPHTRLYRSLPLHRESFRIRTTMHSLATVGPGIALLLLPLVKDKVLAVTLLCGALGMQSFNYSGECFVISLSAL